MPLVKHWLHYKESLQNLNEIEVSPLAWKKKLHHGKGRVHDEVVVKLME